MAERTRKPDISNPYTLSETQRMKPTEVSRVVRWKEKQPHSSLATLLTDVPDTVEENPFHFAVTPWPCTAVKEVNNGGTHGSRLDRSDDDDVTARTNPQGNIVGQQRSIPELQKDIAAKIEEGFMRRMSTAMERAFGNFLKSSGGTMMGEEPQGCVNKPQERESHANATVGLDRCRSPIITPVSSMATVANQQEDLVPTLTNALNADVVALQKPTPEPVPRGGRVKVGRYDGLTSWETYCAQFELLATANSWSLAERVVQLVSALEGEARRVLLDVTTADLEPQAIIRALERQFGNTIPAVVMQQRFNERVQEPVEKLGVFATELCYLA